MEKVRAYHRWDRGKHLSVSGYTRPERPKGRKHSIDKKLIRYEPRQAVRDKDGHILGYKL